MVCTPYPEVPAELSWRSWQSTKPTGAEIVKNESVCFQRSLFKCNHWSKDHKFHSSRSLLHLHPTCHNCFFVQLLNRFRTPSPPQVLLHLLQGCHFSHKFWLTGQNLLSTFLGGCWGLWMVQPYVREKKHYQGYNQCWFQFCWSPRYLTFGARWHKATWPPVLTLPFASFLSLATPSCSCLPSKAGAIHRAITPRAPWVPGNFICQIRATVPLNCTKRTLIHSIRALEIKDRHGRST